MKPGGGVSPLTKSLLVASLLHAGLFAYIAYFGPPPKPAAAPMEPLVWVDTPIEPPVEPPPDTPADNEADGAEERVAASAPRGHAGVPAPGTEAPGEGALEPAEPGEGELEGDPEGEQAAPQRPGLSLEQLGIGNSQMFWDREIKKPLSKKARLEKKLRQTISSEIAQQDQKRGLGPEGPVLSRLELETRASPTAPNSAALFRVVTDRRGRIVSLRVLNATGDRRRWDEVARRTLGALAKTELRNKAPHGVTFDIRLVSRVSLPSGADPGFEVRAGGVPLNGGEGSRSASVDVLPFGGETFGTEMPETANGDLPGIQTGKIGGGQGDLADIGAVAQRMVHAFVERLWANEPPPKAADAGAPN